MPDSIGSSEQVRLIGEQIADTAISKFAAKHPELRQRSVVAEIPPPLKWAAVILSAVVTMAASGGVIWLVSSVSEMSITLARMDERMASYVSAQDDRLAELERRTESLEGYHRQASR